ncbi:MAG: hypothetical protein Q4E12_05030 [Coriobacteriia bacterium]|nr:hypothetical protein [Coriobacteriia bacterium]
MPQSSLPLEVQQHVIARFADMLVRAGMCQQVTPSVNEQDALSLCTTPGTSFQIVLSHQTPESITVDVINQVSSLQNLDREGAQALCAKLQQEIPYAHFMMVPTMGHVICESHLKQDAPEQGFTGCVLDLMCLAGALGDTARLLTPDQGPFDESKIGVLYMLIRNEFLQERRS